MPDPAEEPGEASRPTLMSRGVWAAIKKRWRAWLRAIHRDFGYVAVGFTVIYALSGLAINHIKDWDPSFTSTEITKTIEPIGDGESDDAAVQRVTAAVGTGKPDDVYRAGDELRLGYESGAQVTVVGDHVTFQDRSPRFFLRIANWLHYNRGKKAWTYVSDIYAVMLLYLAISGIFMIKGRLGLRWRGAILISIGVGVPLAYVVLSGGPNARSGETAAKPGDTKPGDTKPGDTKPSDTANPGDTKPSDTAKPGDTKAGDTKPGDTKRGAAKAGDTKPGDTKPGDTKPSDAPVAKPERPPVRTPPPGTPTDPTTDPTSHDDDVPQLKRNPFRPSDPPTPPPRKSAPSTPPSPSSSSLKNPFEPSDPSPPTPHPRKSAPSTPTSPSISSAKNPFDGPKPTTPSGAPIDTSLEKP